MATTKSQARVAARNAAAAKKLEARIAKQLKRGAGKGVEAATVFLTARFKETVSVPAPKKSYMVGGIKVYRATSPAIKGAPPRVLSNRLRQGITRKMLTPTIGIVGTNARAEPTKKHPEGFNYPAQHELGKGGKGQWGGGEHQFIKPTVEKYKRELRILVGATVRTELRIRR